MTIQLSNQARVQVEAAASRLRINARPSFYRAVARSLETAPQPISLNDTLRIIQIAMDMVPAADVLCSRALGNLPDEDYDRDIKQTSLKKNPKENYYDKMARQQR
jgi:hypothetical protein